MVSTNVPALHVSECCRFSNGAQVEFEPWLDLVGGVRWRNPETNTEVRFEGIELSIPESLNEESVTAYCGRVAEAVRRRDLRVGTVYPAVWRGSTLRSEESRIEYQRAVRIGVRAAQTLAALGVRTGNVLRLDTAATVTEWTAGNMTNNSDKIKYCIREAVELATSCGQRCALEMQCDLAAMNSPKSVRWLLSLVSRPGLGVLADTAQCAYCVMGLNFPSTLLLPDNWNGNRQDFDRAYRTVCEALGNYVMALHVSQTTLRVESRPCGARYGVQTTADDPAGALDLEEHCGMLVQHVPKGLNAFDAITWNGFRFDPIAAASPVSLTAALEALDRIRQKSATLVPC